MTRVLATVKPSSTLDSSMNFFQPQSCSFLQNLCSVSATATAIGSRSGRVGYHFGNLATTAARNLLPFLKDRAAGTARDM